MLLRYFKQPRAGTDYMGTTLTLLKEKLCCRERGLQCHRSGHHSAGSGAAVGRCGDLWGEEGEGAEEVRAPILLTQPEQPVPC